MANKRNPHFDAILQKLQDGLKPKEIAYLLNVPYNTVTTIRNKFFDTVLLLKKHRPERNQLSFFNNFWQDRD